MTFFLVTFFHAPRRGEDTNSPNRDIYNLYWRRYKWSSGKAVSVQIICSNTTMEGVTVGAIFFMITARSSTNSMTRNRVAPEPTLARPRPDRPRAPTEESTRIETSFMSLTKMARWPAKRRRVSRENCREPAYTHPERIWSRRMPSVRINFI